MSMARITHLTQHLPERVVSISRAVAEGGLVAAGGRHAWRMNDWAEPIVLAGSVCLTGTSTTCRPATPNAPWEQVPAHNRSARIVADDPLLRANHIVGQVLSRGDLIDVAAHLADQRNVPSLRGWTGHIGMVRTGQIHTTKALLPALVDYSRVDTQPWSGHDAVMAVLDPALLLGVEDITARKSAHCSG